MDTTATAPPRSAGPTVQDETARSPRAPAGGCHPWPGGARTPTGAGASSPGVATPRPDVADGTGNRRVHRRYPFEVRIRVTILEGAGWSERPREIPADALDVSQGGLSFLYDQPVPIGVRVVVDVTSAASRRKLYGVVRNCVRLREQTHRVGVQFVTRASPAPGRGGQRRLS